MRRGQRNTSDASNCIALTVTTLTSASISLDVEMRVGRSSLVKTKGARWLRIEVQMMKANLIGVSNSLDSEGVF